jgi:hypothetical protein
MLVTFDDKQLLRDFTTVIRSSQFQRLKRYIGVIEAETPGRSEKIANMVGQAFEAAMTGELELERG